MWLFKGIDTYDRERIYMEDLDLKPVQRAALSLIQNDLRFLYTVIKRINLNKSFPNHRTIGYPRKSDVFSYFQAKS